MATIQLYDKLLEFPLFQGMSQNELMQVVAHTKFNFLKIETGKKIVKDGDKCEHFIFVTNGRIKCETISDDHSYTFVEYISAPFTIQPEQLFGLNQRYRSTFTAEGKVNIITIDKKEVMNLGENFLVFRLNMLNMFTTQAHKLQRMTWQHQPTDMRKRIIRFITNHSQHPAGKKIVYILMEKLGRELNDSRLDISRALNSLEDEGLLVLKRGRIEIPSLESLIKWSAEN